MNGKVIYLGAFGSPESHLRYQEVLAAWHAQQTNPAAMPAQNRTVAEVLALFIAAATSGDRPTSPSHVRHTQRLAVLLNEAGFAARNAAAFDVDHLETLRRRWLGQFSRRYALRQLVRLKTVWRWAERKRFLPAGSWAALQALRIGSGEVPHAVPPVPETDLAKAIVQLARIPAAMVQLQLLTGARPSEVLVLRPAMFDRSKPVWTADLGHEHKGGWRGHRRVLYFGPKAQCLLAPFMLREPDAYLFDPREAEREFKNRTGRRQPRARPRGPGKRYTYFGYRQAICRACKRAGVPCFGANRLRHNAASRLYAEFGAQVAATILGHRELGTLRHYVADDISRIIEAVRKTG